MKTTLAMLVLVLMSCENSIKKDYTYFNEEPPTMVPKVFAPNVVSTDSAYEFGSVFNKEVSEFFYGVDLNGKSEISYAKLSGNLWSAPVTILEHDRYGFNDPFLSPDENRLYFISRMPLEGSGNEKDFDIWYVKRKENGWSEPINAGPNINSTANEYYISFNSNGKMYFSSNKKDNDFDIYSAELIDGEFQPAIPLGDSINTNHYEADVFVDPSESYIIFCATRPDGFGEGDLYISFKGSDGNWTKSKNMGLPINSEHHELCPFVTHDGKFLFYTSNKDIYWVSASVISELRKKG